MNNLIEEAIREYFGERCPDFEPGCPCRAGGGPHMSEWQPIDTAPKDQFILLYGRIDPSTEFEKLTWEKPTVFSGYWCWMHDAWCPSGGTWAGPFMEVTHWMPLPQPPEEGRT